MDMKVLIKKYEKELKELLKFKSKLATEYSKTGLNSTKETFNQTVTKINTLKEVLEDLKEI